MAKKVQMSTVEMVAKALTDKGYCVDDVELDKGVVTVAALAPHGSTLLDSFKQTEARKWLDSVPDMSIVDVEPELSVEEWEAQYGHLSDEDVAQALAPMIEPEQVRDDLNREIAADNLEDYHNQPIVVEEVEPVAGAALETPEGETTMEVETRCAECGRDIMYGELYYRDGTGDYCTDCQEMAREAEQHLETPEGEMTMESKLFVCVNECGTVVDHEGDLCPDCAKAFEAVAVKEDALYEQYLSVREPYFDENPDLAMVFEAMLYRRWLYVRYQTDYTNGTSVIRDRKWLPSHVYQASSTGGVCVVAFDVCKKNGREERSIKTFRIDKIRGAHLGEIAPPAKGDAVTLYPAAYEVRRSMPQRVSNPGKYLATGNWATTPLPQVLTQ